MTTMGKILYPPGAGDKALKAPASAFMDPRALAGRWVLLQSTTNRLQVPEGRREECSWGAGGLLRVAEASFPERSGHSRG